MIYILEHRCSLLCCFSHLLFFRAFFLFFFFFFFLLSVGWRLASPSVARAACPCSKPPFESSEAYWQPSTAAEIRSELRGRECAVDSAKDGHAYDPVVWDREE